MCLFKNWNQPHYSVSITVYFTAKIKKHFKMAETPKLRVAVVGAGIAGLAAAIAFKSHPGIDVHIYERAGELQEIGASIALGPNGMRTLDRLGVNNALSPDIAFRNKSRCPMIYR